MNVSIIVAMPVTILFRANRGKAAYNVSIKLMEIIIIFPASGIDIRD